MTSVLKVDQLGRHWGDCRHAGRSVPRRRSRWCRRPPGGVARRRRGGRVVHRRAARAPRPDRRGRRPRLRHPRRRVRSARTGIGNPPRPPRRAARPGQDRPGHDVDRPPPDGHDDAHRAVPHLQEHRHARPRLRRPGRLARGGVDHGRGGQRRSAARPHDRSTSCGRRPTTPSRWPAGSGTAGRTTPSSATGRPAGTSTATSCTTSTSPAASSPSAARRSRPARRRANRWWRSPPAAPRRPRSPRGGPTSCSSTPPTSVRPRSRRETIRRLAGDAGRDPDTVAVLAVVRIGEPGLRAELDRRGHGAGHGRRDSSPMPRPSPPGCGRGPTRTPSTASCSAPTCCRRRSSGWPTDVLPRLDRPRCGRRRNAPRALRARRPANRYAAEEVLS